MASEEELKETKKADAAAAEGYSGFGDIHWAAARGDVPALRHFLREDPEKVHEKGLYGDTPLHIVARNGKVEAAEFLLSKGAAVDAKNNRGKTPLDLAREKGRKQMEQLLNPPAKEPSADDGKTPPDLSSKGKAEKELLPTAADKASEAGKKAQQTPAFAFSSPPRQTSKEEHAAAAEECKAPVQRADKASEEVKKAAQELKKAMESGNAQALKEAIDKAKLHKVSPEEVMEAMDKYIALRETADGAALLPAQEAARELKKAMESGNAHVLKQALDKAKLHKVSPEEVMEAMDKYIALRESADPAAPSKPLEVKLESGRGARLGMFSARFNAKNRDTEMKFRAVHKLLLENQYEVLMVDAGAGQRFGDMTAEYLHRLHSENGIMLAVCTSDYGEMTESTFSSCYELRHAKTYNLDVLPLQVEEEWKPNPPCGEGHRDGKKSALAYISMVFHPDLVRVDCRNKSIEEIASDIAAVLRKPA